MTTKHHTSTPWIVGKQNINAPSNTVMQLKQSGPYKSLAYCDTDDDPTNEANAAYIVKAVNCHSDLLYCVEELLEHIEWRRRVAGEKAGENDCTHRARAAIERARV